MISKRVIAELALLARPEVRQVASAWAETLGRAPDDPALLAAMHEAFLCGLPQAPGAELVRTRQGRAALAEIPNLTLVQSSPTVRLRGGETSNLYIEATTLEKAAADLRLLFHGMRLGRVLRHAPNGDVVDAATGELVISTPALPGEETGAAGAESGGGRSAEPTAREGA